MKYLKIEKLHKIKNEVIEENKQFEFSSSIQSIALTIWMRLHPLERYDIMELTKEQTSKFKSLSKKQSINLNKIIELINLAE